ncbi:MAG: two-component system, OmpR family, response regulator QseB [Gammaproteobacteria bacterium]|jgi:DNA-binding response OmpR family regulator|nr:two-component system, OmpR family, response regulator QseB [Gammaproteobacteria bacterium]
MRLLVIEDEERIVELLRSAFERAGFVVDSVGSTVEADQALSSVAYDAAILDLGLPDGDGLRVLANIRSSGNRVPVLILTARDTVEERVGGLDSGADDYLVKPFAVTELISRIKALLRRPGHALGITLQAGNLAFDTIGRDVRVGTIPFSVSRHELAILEHLMRRMGRVVPRSVLEEKLYGMDEPLESNAIPVHIHHLRRKLAEVGATPVIHTVRGIGYLLAEKPV